MAACTDFNIEQVVKSEEPDVLCEWAIYLDKTVVALEHYLTQRQRVSLPADDIATIKEACTRASYVAILFRNLSKSYNKDVPDQFNFDSEMESITELADPMLRSMVSFPVSITMCIDIDVELGLIIEKYYQCKPRRSFWDIFR